jgi:hypothetical protein
MVFGFFAFFVFLIMSKVLARCTNPQPGGPGDFGQVFLPLALDNSISNCREAVLILAHPRYFISPVPTISGVRSPIHHRGRRPMGD